MMRYRHLTLQPALGVWHNSCHCKQKKLSFLRRLSYENSRMFWEALCYPGAKADIC